MIGAFRLVIIIGLSAVLFCWGCGGSPERIKKIPVTVNAVKAAKGYSKKVALALVRTPATTIGKTTGERYLKFLAESINRHGGGLQLLTPDNPDFPAFLPGIPDGTSQPLDPGLLFEKGRRAGYQGIIAAGINNIRPVAKKTGMMWFRKTRYFLHYSVTLDLFDPFTGAKIVSEVMEDSLKISEEVYESIKTGSGDAPGDLNSVIEELADDHGEQIAEALDNHLWKSIVILVEDDRVFLPAISGSGLQRGDRLAVFENRRRLESKYGVTFNVPGVQIAEVEIITVNEDQVETRTVDADGIQAGDIVIPVR